MELPPRTETGAVVLSLVLLTTILSITLSMFGISSTLLEISPLALVLIYVVSLYLGVTISERGFRGQVSIEYAGVVVLVLLHSVYGSLFVDDIMDTAGPGILLGTVVFVLVYSAAVTAYGYRRKNLFGTWRAKAILAAFSTLLLLLAGSFLRPIYLAAFCTLGLVMLLEVLHVIGRTKAAGRMNHMKDAGWIYAVMVGFPITLTKALGGLLFRGRKGLF